MIVSIFYSAKHRLYGGNRRYYRCRCIKNSIKRWKVEICSGTYQDYAKTNRADQLAWFWWTKPSAFNLSYGWVMSLTYHRVIQYRALAFQWNFRRRESGRLFINFVRMGYLTVLLELWCGRIESTFGASAKMRNEVTDSAMLNSCTRLIMKNESVWKKTSLRRRQWADPLVVLRRPSGKLCLNIIRYNLPSITTITTCATWSRYCWGCDACRQHLYEWSIDNYCGKKPRILRASLVLLKWILWCQGNARHRPSCYWRH